MPEGEPRIRLALVLLATLVAVTLPDPRSAGLGLAVAVAGVISWGHLDRVVLFRWAMLGLILAITASPLPFTVSGEARWWIAGIPLTQPGIELAITWWCRGMAAGGLILSILAPLPLWRLLQAAGWWRCPNVLLILVLLVHRHGSALAEERRRLGEAAALRGWYLSARPRPLTQLGGMLGALIIRTERRATSISEAMTLRGFTGSIPQPQWNSFGIVQVLAACVLAIALLAGGIYPWLF